MLPEKSGYCHPVQVPQAQAEQSKWSLPRAPLEPLSLGRGVSPVCISSFPLSMGSSQLLVMFRSSFSALFFPLCCSVCRQRPACWGSVSIPVPSATVRSFSQPAILASGAPRARLLPCHPWALLCCSPLRLLFHSVPHQVSVLNLPLLCRSAFRVNCRPPKRCLLLLLVARSEFSLQMRLLCFRTTEQKRHWTSPPARSTDPLNPVFPELTLLTSPSEPPYTGPPVGGPHYLASDSR